MGSGPSSLTSSSEVKNTPVIEQATTVRAAKSEVKDEVAKVEEQHHGSSCPMKRADGSYKIDWNVFFRSNVPHGTNVPFQKLPNNSDETTIEMKQSDNSVDEKKKQSVSSNVSSNGCPIKNSKSIEYDVYAQPILNNPNNNMPLNPNQIPSHTQSIPLATERISSSIPKVRLSCFFRELILSFYVLVQLFFC
jgi:hypothetical protein